MIKVNSLKKHLNSIMMKRQDVFLPTGILWEPVLIAEMKMPMATSVKNAELH